MSMPYRLYGDEMQYMAWRHRQTDHTWRSLRANAYDRYRLLRSFNGSKEAKGS